MSSLPVYHMASYFSTSGFVATLILNSTFIYLTTFHMRKIHASYRFLLVVFASICLIFSFIEMLVHPFYHSYNGGLINFNMVKWPGVSRDWITVLVASYSGVYVTIVSFFTVLFWYRYWTMLQSSYLYFFKGWKMLILVMWAIVFGFLGGAVVLYFGWIDEFSENYMREVMLEHYNLNMSQVSGYTVIAYDERNNIRWDAFGFSFGIIALMGIQFSIVTYCGIQMHLKMNEMLENLSVAQQRLQRQFFKSLITSPSLTFYIPAVAILTVPFLNLKWSLPTGLIVCSFAVYPPLDSLLLMLIVSEYRSVIKAHFLNPSSLFRKNSVHVATSPQSAVSAPRVNTN